jgi:hypothetical protein
MELEGNEEMNQNACESRYNGPIRTPHLAKEDPMLSEEYPVVQLRTPILYRDSCQHLPVDGRCIAMRMPFCSFDQQKVYRTLFSVMQRKSRSQCVEWFQKYSATASVLPVI